MALNINPVENHREREKGVIVYPVYSRRACGLSVGINLFPNRKVCNFDCPYCEVFPFTNKSDFSLKQMEDDLRKTIIDANGQNIIIKDICFSGNGEPTLSCAFQEALALAANIRSELAPKASIVVITNGTGLLKQAVFSSLKKFVEEFNLDIWLKLDAAAPEWYKKINRSSVQFDEYIAKINDFVSCVPVTIQTMLCSINGSPPPPEEEKAWVKLIQELAAAGNIKKVQIYGKARPAPEDPLATALPFEFLEERSALVRDFVSVEIYK